jgi:hypothetical protein
LALWNNEGLIRYLILLIILSNCIIFIHLSSRNWVVFVSTILSADRISSRCEVSAMPIPLRPRRDMRQGSLLDKVHHGNDSRCPPWARDSFVELQSVSKCFANYFLFRSQVWQLFLHSWRTSVHKFKTKKGIFFVSGPFQWQSLLLSTPERGADVCSLRQVFVSQLSNSVINATKLKAGSTLSKRRFKKTNINASYHGCWPPRCEVG